MEENRISTYKASSNRIVADLNLMASTDPEVWERAYQLIMDDKYKKGTRKFSGEVNGVNWPLSTDPPIYIIPRIRTESYKAISVNSPDPSVLVNSSTIHYVEISKGFSGQDVSSFTLGPIVGEGFCLVNAAFSKCISIMHIEGGGKLNLKRVCFWESAKQPIRNITLIDDQTFIIDGVKHNINEWLINNENLWFPQ